MTLELGRQLRCQAVGTENHDAAQVFLPVPPEYAAQHEPANGKEAFQEKERKDAERDLAYVSHGDVLDRQQQHHQQPDSQQEARNQCRHAPAAPETIEAQVFRKQHPGKNGTHQINDKIQRSQGLVPTVNPSAQRLFGGQGKRNPCQIGGQNLVAKLFGFHA